MVRPAEFGLLLLTAIFLGACSGSGTQQIQDIAISTNEVQAVPTSQGRNDYRLGSGDKIKLVVYNEDDLSGEFDVSGNGLVSLPLVGQVPVGGLTIGEFEGRVTSKLRTYLKNPRVSAQVLNYRPFYIRGEVKNGGEYPFVNGIVVADAVAKAGGYTYRAVTSYVYIRRANETTERKYSLADKVKVLPGDNIRVPERIF